MSTTVIQSRQYREMRAGLKDQWQAVNAPCCICGQADIEYDGEPNQSNSFELQHIISRKRRPDLALDPNNCGPSHVRCNRAQGAGNARPTIGENTEDW